MFRFIKNIYIQLLKFFSDSYTVANVYRKYYGVKIGQNVRFTDKYPHFGSEPYLIEIGNDVCVIGNSFGLGASLSCGVISAKNRKNIGFNEIENFIQTDAAVNPGDSGAPLLNNKGQLIGMVDAIFTKEADIDAGVNFAIDNKLIYEFINMNLEIIK